MHQFVRPGGEGTVVRFYGLSLLGGLFNLALEKGPYVDRLLSSSLSFFSPTWVRSSVSDRFSIFDFLIRSYKNVSIPSR